MSSVFAKYQTKAYPYRFEADLLVRSIAGGVPSDPKVAEGFINTKLAASDDIIRQAVAEMMIERGITMDEAADEVARNKHLVGFRRDEHGLYIPGAYLKAALKEAASVARSVGKLPDRWGLTKKGIVGFVAEHIFVIEDRVHLGVSAPTGIALSFPKSRFGSSIQLSEYVEDAKLTFSVETDYDFTEEEWGQLWLHGERQGLGASRSQGYGRYVVTRWDKVT